MNCAAHLCVLGGCIAWNKRFKLTGHTFDRTVTINGKTLTFASGRVVECRGCREHRDQGCERPN